MELEEKYLVLKRSDMDLALTREQKAQLAVMCYQIECWRDSLMKPLNKYVVINLDEPYASQVLALMDQAERPKEIGE